MSPYQSENIGLKGTKYTSAKCILKPKVQKTKAYLWRLTSYWWTSISKRYLCSRPEEFSKTGGRLDATKLLKHKAQGKLGSSSRRARKLISKAHQRLYSWSQKLVRWIKLLFQGSSLWRQKPGRRAPFKSSFLKHTNGSTREVRSLCGE